MTDHGPSTNPPFDRGAARVQVSGWLLAAALLAAPLAWFVDLSVSYSLAAHGCFPHRTPLPGPTWPHLHAGLAALLLAALLLVAGGTGIAYYAWRKSRKEQSGSHHDLLEAGEGRTRFLAICALMAGPLFGVGLLFDALALVLVPACAWP